MAKSKEDLEFNNAVDQRLGKRGRLRKELTKKDPELNKLFSEQSDEQKNWGKLVGKIITARSNEQIEEAFDWFREECNKKIDLTYREKIIAFFHALASLECDAVQYRILRRMFIKANMGT